MPASEFDLIARYFSAAACARAGEGVVLGIGDDAAILRTPAGEDLVVSIDTLVAGVHFPQSLGARDVGYRALAVNLSDLAAMGARPLWFTLALTLPSADESWLAGFVAALDALAVASSIALVGGDTTHGPLSITIQVHGAVPSGTALRRDGARPGDAVWVSGAPGLAALGLQRLLGRNCDDQSALRAFLEPQPRLALGRALRGVASAAIDVSDGLLADAGHLAERSGVRIELEAGLLPLAPALQGLPAADDALRLCLGGGDDYELCFTAPDEMAGDIARIARECGVPCARIGRVISGEGICCRGAPAVARGYDHFAEGSA